jgi:hypothetical protein
MKACGARGAFVAVVLAISAIASEAAADPTACVDAADRGQRARKEGKLQDARDHFLSCAAPMCPDTVQKDCLRWANDTIDVLPSIVIDATDEDGRDIGDARVLIDGYEAAVVTEGRSIEIDPGPHTIRVERSGHIAVEQKIIAKEGMHARRVAAILLRPHADGAPTSAPSTAAAASDRSTSAAPSWTIAAMGFGAATAGIGTLMIIGSDELMPGEERNVVRTFGWAAVAIGGAAALGGLFGYVSEPAKPRMRAGITITPVFAFGRF